MLNSVRIDRIKISGLNNITRLRDIVVALVGLIFLAPFALLVAVWIKRDSEGPVFYRGPRAAKDGNEFRILKFRTMYERLESYSGPKITAEHDDRITPVGKWLRYTKLNELPQLWNVLVGEMSLVGPRPEDPDIVAGWSQSAHREILSVRPGITSPASVLFRHEETQLSAGNLMEMYLKSVQPSKMRLDQLYVHHRSFWLDLDVLLWTGLVLLPRLGRHSPHERYLFFGPLAKFRHQLINWFVVDLILVFLSFGAAGVFLRAFGPIHIGLGLAMLISLGYSYIFSIVGWVIGIYKISWSKAVVKDVLYLVASVFLSVVLGLILNQYLVLLPPEIIVLAAILSFGGFVVVRYRERLFSGLLSIIISMNGAATQWRERVLIVGSGDAGQISSWMLENTREANKYYVVGFIDDDMFKVSTRIRGLSVLGGREDIHRIVNEHDVGIIMFAIHNIDKEEQKKVLEICQTTTAQVVIVPNMMAEIASASKRNGHKLNGHSNQQVSAAQIKKWLDGFRENLEQGEVENCWSSLDALEEMIGEA